MEKNQYELCLEVLRRLDRTGVLKYVILIGSWCLPFYREYFSSTRYSVSIRTRDVDLLVVSPKDIRVHVDVPALLKDMGFVVRHHGAQGYMKLEHPDLMVEFLSPEKSRGKDEPVNIPKLGVNAQALRYLNFLVTDIMTVHTQGLTLRMPHPVYFALHKLIVSQNRPKKEKAEKDKEAAVMLLRVLIRKGDTVLIRSIFDATLPAWQKTILKGLQDLEDRDILKVLVER